MKTTISWFVSFLTLMFDIFHLPMIARKFSPHKLTHACTMKLRSGSAKFFIHSGCSSHLENEVQWKFLITFETLKVVYIKKKLKVSSFEWKNLLFNGMSTWHIFIFNFSCSNFLFILCISMTFWVLGGSFISQNYDFVTKIIFHNFMCNFVCFWSFNQMEFTQKNTWNSKM